MPNAKMKMNGMYRTIDSSVVPWLVLKGPERQNRTGAKRIAQDSYFQIGKTNRMSSFHICVGDPTNVQSCRLHTFFKRTNYRAVCER